jgi:8-amino-7-oxononanoate synthase
LIRSFSFQSSNDYLSITHSSSLRDRYLRRLEECSAPLFGSTGSRLLDGTTPYHTALEQRLARLFRYTNEAHDADPSSPDTSALLFNSGYDANVSFFSTVPQRGDYIVHDELVHASVWDGMRGNARRGVSETHRYSFRHNSVDALEQVLREIIRLEIERSGRGMVYVSLESLYSMDGDLAPLDEILVLLDSLRQEYPRHMNPNKVILVLDEAHTTGISGRGGRGLAWHLQDGVQDSEHDERCRIRAKRVREWCQVRVMTFGKAVGGQGGESERSEANSYEAYSPLMQSHSCTRGISHDPTISHQLCSTVHFLHRHVGQQRFSNRKCLGRLG